MNQISRFFLGCSDLTDLECKLRPFESNFTQIFTLLTHFKPFVAKQWIILLVMTFTYTAWAQPGAILSINKPTKYENRTLASEKPTDKPINPLRRATQNLSSHYNYHFNATQKMNDILSNARLAQKEDYGKLIPFYAISLQNTASQTNELDSVLLKCNDAILLHDLRSDWVDDFYALMGKAYFYKKDFDSALISFQYVNYAFQPRSKEEIGFPKAIGSTVTGESNAYTISTKEKNNPLATIFSTPPARNESLLWIIRTLIEKEQHGDAWSLIETLKRDKQFPKRLQTSLKEIQGYLFYKEAQYDSAALYLEGSLSEFPASEKARQEFLLAQLYEKAKNNAKATYWYDKVIGHTTDLVMEAFARINRIKLFNSASSNQQIHEQINELLKMVQKEKYADYKQIIYYAVAQMEKTRDSIPSALFYLQKTAENSKDDPTLRNKSLMELGDLAWDKHLYKMAAFGYDSVAVTDSSIGIDLITLNQRKAVLSKIITFLDIIQVEDSLLHIASMPEAERNNYIKSILRQLRKAKGLKDEAIAAANFTGATSAVIDPTKEEKPADLFAANGTKGEWYFYNISLKSKGIREFEATWGKRPNVDNWRRAKTLNAITNANTQRGQANETDIQSTKGNSKTEPAALTMEALEANLPLTEEKRNASLDSIESSLYQLGKLFRESLNDCSSTVLYNESLLNRFPKTKYTEEVLFGLYFCYKQMGNISKAETYKNYLAQQNNKSRYLRMINDPKGVEKENQQLTQLATTTYEHIYEAFIEGDFTKAMADKRMADSSFGENYWTPQLLYIESIYHIKQRNDSLALSVLNKLQMLFPTSAIAPKAKILSNVLSKRAELEKYLTELNVERAVEDSIFISAERAKTNEKISHTEPSTPQKLQQPTPTLTAPEVPRQKETVETAPVKAEKETRFSKPIIAKADTSAFIKPVPVAPVNGYSFNPAHEHIVILILQKVDVVYQNEAKIALIRYTKEKTPEVTLDIQRIPYSEEINFMTLAKFPDLLAAESYKKSLIADAPRMIFPWLPAAKYSFISISPANLERMRNKKELDRYQQLFKENFPLK